MEAFRFSSILDVNFRQLVHLREFPRLRAIPQISVRKIEHRCHEHCCNPEGLEGHRKAVRWSGRSHDGHRALSIATEHRLQQIRLFRLGWQAGAWPTTLDVRD